MISIEILGLWKKKLLTWLGCYWWTVNSKSMFFYNLTFQQWICNLYRLIRKVMWAMTMFWYGSTFCILFLLWNMMMSSKKWKHFPRYWPFVWGIHIQRAENVSIWWRHHVHWWLMTKKITVHGKQYIIQYSIGVAVFWILIIWWLNSWPTFSSMELSHRIWHVFIMLNVAWLNHYGW